MDVKFLGDDGGPDERDRRKGWRYGLKRKIMHHYKLELDPNVLLQVINWEELWTDIGGLFLLDDFQFLRSILSGSFGRVVLN